MRKRIEREAAYCFSTLSCNDESLPLEKRVALLKLRTQNFLNKIAPKKEVRYFFMCFGEKEYISPAEVKEYERRGVKVFKEE
jgi:hypothetical protein